MGVTFVTELSVILNSFDLSLHPAFEQISRLLETEALTRILAFGSSNTERAEHSLGGHNWFDWVDVGLRHRYGRVHHSLNVGVCGETAEQLLERFERDVAFYQPHVVFITIGGNDSNPERDVSAETYRSQLVELVGRVRGLESIPILQTYYSADAANLAAEYAEKFALFMDIVREVAGETQTALIDHLLRWERLREAYPDSYRTMMLDAMHVNRIGNMVWGLDVCRYFDAPLVPADVSCLSEATPYMDLLDQLEAEAE